MVVDTNNSLLSREGMENNMVVFNDAVFELISRLQMAGLLGHSFKIHRDWHRGGEIPLEQFISVLRAHLTPLGYHRILQTTRNHNRQIPDGRWELSRPHDFLNALEAALATCDISSSDGDKQVVAFKGSPSSVQEGQVSSLVQELQYQVCVILESLRGQVQTSRWNFSLKSLWSKFESYLRKVGAQAQIDHILRRVALLAARDLREEVKCAATLARIDRLRSLLRNQLQSYCEESGFPMPKPYSLEEAYCLHLLTAYYLSLAEAEKRLTKQWTEITKRELNLTQQIEQAKTDAASLSELMDILSRVDPLRESLFRERVRHRIAILVGALVAAVGGVIYGFLESLQSIFIYGLAQYAPIMTPPLLVGLITLVAQTVVGGMPLTLKVLLDYLARSLWNATLAFGITLTVFGCWQYIRSHRQALELSRRVNISEGQSNHAETANPATG
jgi:hypothetical protein